MSPSEAARAGAVLARAFHDDPVWVWCLPDERRRHRLLPWIFTRIAALETRRGYVHATADLRGVAIWVPPDSTAPRRLDQWRSGIHVLRWRARRAEYDRVLAYQHASRELLQRAMPGGAWFLSGLGVEPAAQRAGRGGALVEWGVGRAEAERVPAELLTSNADNLPFYERHGFRVVVVEEVPAGGPLTWAMRRG